MDRHDCRLSGTLHRKMVCSLQLFHEALNRPYDEPKKWEQERLTRL